MRPAKLLLIVSGLSILLFVSSADAQTIRAASPYDLSLPQPSSEPYYVSKGGNGNEAYPKIEPPAVKTESHPEGPGDGCDCCCQNCCQCPPLMRLKLDWLGKNRGGKPWDWTDRMLSRMRCTLEAGRNFIRCPGASKAGKGP